MAQENEDKLDLLFRAAAERSPGFSIGKASAVIKNTAGLAVPSIPMGVLASLKLSPLLIITTAFTITSVGVFITNLQKPDPQAAATVLVEEDQVETAVDDTLGSYYTSTAFIECEDTSNTSFALHTIVEETSVQGEARPKKKSFSKTNTIDQSTERVLEPDTTDHTPNRYIRYLTVPTVGIVDGPIEGFKELEEAGRVSARIATHPPLKRSFEISTNWTPEHMDELVSQAGRMGINASFQNVRYKNAQLSGFDLELVYNGKRCVFKAKNLQARITGSQDAQAKISADPIKPHEQSKMAWVVSNSGNCVSLTREKDSCGSTCHCDQESTLFSLRLK